MSFTLNIDSLGAIMKLAEKYPEVAEPEINNAINRSLLRIKREAVLNAPVGVSGAGDNLRDKWNIVLGRFEGSISSGKKYALGVEKGTAPHWVPTEQLKPWADKKGIPVFLVQRSIAKKGTRAQPFFAPAVETAREGINQEFTTALENIKKKVLQ